MSFDDYEEEKPWELKDDFKFAPEKPEGDPWTLLGEPLLTRDEKLCKILRDEVNNLLLFAGLFSAVITAFVIESYHNLQPDPNADIISILSQISANLINNANGGNQSTPSSSAVIIPSTSFSPSQSSVRVNIAWFTSLIFSLTSVLVSIVALQWLRSHQTYSGLSPRDSLAILNMRSESLHKWQVASIIMSLPVLLEVSLLLFFAGLIDFLISIGNKAVVIFVAVAIGLTMLFLLVTTTLPTVQAVLLRFSSMYPSQSFEKKPPPSQCPYKSPQSLAFHHGCSVTIRGIRMIYFWIQGLRRNISQHSSIIRQLEKASSRATTRHRRAFLNHLSTIYTQDTWTDIDLAWLGIRDAAQHSADYSEPDIEELDQLSMTERSLPLYDIVQSFQKATGADYTHTFGSALYHCFYELSYASVMTSAMKRFRLRIFRADNTWDVISQNVLERNRYFQSLISVRGDDNPRDNVQDAATRTPNSFIDFGPPKYLHVLTSNIQILHHQNLLLHLDNLNENDRYSKTMSDHRKEIMIRLGKALYQRDLALQPQTFSLPPYLRGKIFEQGLSNLYSNANTVSLFYQYSCMVSDFFDHAENVPIMRLTPISLATHPDIPEFLENASWDMYRSIVAFSLPRTTSHDHVKVTNTFHKVVDGLMERMHQPNKKLKSGATGDLSSHSSARYFLYCSAIYARRLSALIGLGKATSSSEFKLPEEVLDKMNVLLHEMALYKDQVSPDTEKNDLVIFLEKRFRGMDRYGSVSRFSREWWSFLDTSPGHHDRTLGRSRPTWFEDAFFDQLRRVTSSTLAYTSPIIAVQNTHQTASDTISATHPENIVGPGSYTLQIVQVPAEMQPSMTSNTITDYGGTKRVGRSMSERIDSMETMLVGTGAKNAGNDPESGELDIVA